ncbi:LysR family transcriptional regulator [Aliidiomarina shirensis]|uniref:LysR family transcriptional regulator n=1 Tax=Aliidiomarina shirensis TaxID=1048642 RepID=A0A432WKV7_9GAMM|nr:LysR family transcriptional regulator [Aliidiomarina shirensis]RUO34404.1 LysR family transcriptional regulator [Aliidiomarina shirensis]
MRSLKLRNIDLNLLVVLDVLLAEQHVSRAAERLNMSQPAVSRALGRLRETLNDPILIRTASGFTLSSRAVLLRGELDIALRDIERVIEPPSFDPSTDDSLIRLTGLDMEIGLYFPVLIKRLRKIAPSMRFEVVRQEHDSFPMLERDDVHFSLSGLAPMSAEHSLHRKTLQEMKVVCLMAENHALAHGSMTAEEYANTPHGLVSITGRGPGSMEQVLAQHGLQRKVALRLSGFTSVADFLEDSDLIFTLPERLAERIAQGRKLCIRPLPAPLKANSVRFYLYWHERYHNDPRMIWIREQLSATLA